MPETLANEPIVNAQPVVSVIIIARNQAGEVRQALKALDASRGAAGESAPAMEILVVDCGSRDDIRAVETERGADVFESPTTLSGASQPATFLFMPGDFGATKALNMAVRSAKADLLFLLSPEIEVLPETVAALAGRLEADSSAAAACPLLVDESGHPVAFLEPLPSGETLAQVCAGGGSAAAAPDPTREALDVEYPGRVALLVRKQFVIGMNYFDQRFGEYWADADLALQMRRAQRKIRLYPAIRAVWHRPAATAALDNEHLSDRYLGAAVLLGKHDGFLAAWSFRVRAALKALGSFNFGLLGALLSGKKLGSHAN